MWGADAVGAAALLHAEQPRHRPPYAPKRHRRNKSIDISRLISISLWSGHRLRKAKPAAGGLKDKEQEPLRLALRYLERARSLEHSALRAIVREASSCLCLTSIAFADLARHMPDTFSV